MPAGWDSRFRSVPQNITTHMGNDTLRNGTESPLTLAPLLMRSLILIHSHICAANVCVCVCVCQFHYPYI